MTSMEYDERSMTVCKKEWNVCRRPGARDGSIGAKGKHGLMQMPGPCWPQRDIYVTFLLTFNVVR